MMMEQDETTKPSCSDMDNKTDSRTVNGDKSPTHRDISYTSVMFPLDTGQSRMVMLETYSTVEQAPCQYCWEYATVLLSNNKRVKVGECPDCALDNTFDNGYGMRISETIQLDTFIKQPDKYQLTATSWLNAYLEGHIESWLMRYHKQDDIDELLETVIQTTESKIGSDKCLGRHSEVFASPKLVARTRKRLEEDADNDCWADRNLVKRLKQMDIVSEPQHKRRRI